MKCPTQKMKNMQGKNLRNIPSEKKNVPDLADDFLGAAHVFAAVMNNVLEEDLLRDAAGGQLTVSQMKLLKLIGMNDSTNVGDIAAFLKVSKAAASKAADKLVRKMYLRRSPGKLDRRESCLALTEMSRKLLSRYEKERGQKIKEIFSISVPAELRQVSALLDCLTARLAIENLSAQPGRLCLECGTYFRDNCSLRAQLGRQCFHLRKK